MELNVQTMKDSEGSLDTKTFSRVKIIGFLLTSNFFLVALHFSKNFPLDQSYKTLTDVFIRNFWEVEQLVSILLCWTISFVYLERLLKNKPDTFRTWLIYFISLYIVWVASFEILRYSFIRFHLVSCSDWCGIELIIFPLYLVPIILFVSSISFFSRELKSEARPILAGVMRFISSPYTIAVFFLLGVALLCSIAYDYNTQGRYLGMSIQNNFSGNEDALKREVIRNDYTRYCSIASDSNMSTCRETYEKFCSKIQFREERTCKENFFAEVIPKLHIEEKIDASPQIKIKYMKCADLFPIYGNGSYCDKEDRRVSPNGLLVIEFQSKVSSTTQTATQIPLFQSKNLFFDETLPQFLIENTDYGYDPVAKRLFVHIETIIDQREKIYDVLRGLASKEKLLSNSSTDTPLPLVMYFEKDFGFQILSPGWMGAKGRIGPNKEFQYTFANYSLSSRDGALPPPSRDGDVRIDIATGCNLKNSDDYISADKVTERERRAVFKTVCKNDFQFVLWLWGGESRFTEHDSLLNQIVESFKMVM